MHHIIDKEHGQLKQLLDIISTHISKGHSIGIILNLFNDFIILANKHFKNEEKIMDSNQYPGLLTHKQEHDRLLNQLETMKSQLKGGQTPFGKDLIIWQTNWIEVHLSTFDEKLIDFLKMKEKL